MPEDFMPLFPDGPRLQLPTEGELSPSEINSLISTANTIRKIDLESRAAARRYRGQQQLQALIGQGVPMDQAMQRVAGDLFYNDASGFLSYRNAEENRKLRELTQKRLEQQAAAMDLHRSIMEAQGQQRLDRPTKVDTSSLNRQLTGVNSRIKQAEAKMAKAADEEERTAAVSELNTLYDERDAVQQGLKEAGAPVAITPRPTFETVKQVLNPVVNRSWFNKIPVPGLYMKPPVPVTNMVTRMVAPPLPTAPTTATNNIPTVDESQRAQQDILNSLPPSGPAVREVQRKTKDGRIAIFNADTKEFLRYAD